MKHYPTTRRLAVDYPSRRVSRLPVYSSASLKGRRVTGRGYGGTLESITRRRNGPGTVAPRFATPATTGWSTFLFQGVEGPASWAVTELISATAWATVRLIPTVAEDGAAHTRHPPRVDSARERHDPTPEYPMIATELTTYKLRAEVPDDVEVLALVLKRLGITVHDWQMTAICLPDVELTFASAERIEVLRQTIATIEDGHVMYQTLARADEYTGERTYADPPAPN